MLPSHYGDYLGASPKRLADACKLLAPPGGPTEAYQVDLRHLCGAQYLAGYAVECALKAYIIHQLHSRRRTRRVETWDAVIQLRPELAGAESHKLELLLKATDLAGQMGGDTALAKAWGQCCKWTAALRYSSRPIGGTGEIIQACERVSRWVLRQLPRTLGDGWQ